MIIKYFWVKREVRSSEKKLEQQLRIHKFSFYKNKKYNMFEYFKFCNFDTNYKYKVYLKTLEQQVADGQIAKLSDRIIYSIISPI